MQALADAKEAAREAGAKKAREAAARKAEEEAKRAREVQARSRHFWVFVTWHTLVKWSGRPYALRRIARGYRALREKV